MVFGELRIAKQSQSLESGVLGLFVRFTPKSLGSGERRVAGADCETEPIPGFGRVGFVRVIYDEWPTHLRSRFCVRRILRNKANSGNRTCWVCSCDSGLSSRCCPRPKERKIAFDLAFLGTTSSSRVEYSIFKDLGAEPLARMPALLVLVASLVEVRFGAEPSFGEYVFVSSICGPKIVVIVKSGLERS